MNHKIVTNNIIAILVFFSTPEDLAHSEFCQTRALIDEAMKAMIWPSKHELIRKQLTPSNIVYAEHRGFINVMKIL